MDTVKDKERMNEILNEILERIEKEVWDTLADNGNDWFTSMKVYEAMEIVKEYIDKN